MLSLLTLEEHYLSPALHAVPHISPLYATFPPPLLAQLLDLDAPRLAAMDAGSVSLQVISHGPGVGDPAQCHAANDDLAAAIARHPTRLAGFATLPMGAPLAAAEELARCVADLGFVGALLENHFEGRYYDDEAFWPVFARAEELGTVLYLHPAFPTGALRESYRGNYPADTELGLSIAGWGWHADTGLHVLRLFGAGIFDRFPGLKLVIGHMGEMLPFQLERILGMEARLFAGRKRGLRRVWDENVWVTTSGMVGTGPFACLLRTTRVERILYSVDYPFSSNVVGKRFLEEVRAKGMVSQGEMEMIGWRNAEGLLGVRVQVEG